mmetsp:Transcript_33501/g.44706  ORF Transcript_33501/g.44706 Transcript_33501/m.44706 type:complete len:122 (+) Transcript_33501:51-416(+)
MPKSGWLLQCQAMEESKVIKKTIFVFESVSLWYAGEIQQEKLPLSAIVGYEMVFVSANHLCKFCELSSSLLAKSLSRYTVPLAEISQTYLQPMPKRLSSMHQGGRQIQPQVDQKNFPLPCR